MSPCNEISEKTDGGRVCNYGRVQIYQKRNWGSVCDVNWTKPDGNVTCKHLGFDEVIEFYKTDRKEGDGSVGLRNIICHGNETSLFGCSKETKRECPDERDVSVHCKVEGKRGNIVPFNKSTQTNNQPNSN